MQKEVAISNLQFVPAAVKILPNTTVVFRVKKHSASEVYSSSERNFILECSLFSSPKLFSEDSFSYEFAGFGEYLVTCPFYPHMKLSVSVASTLEEFRPVPSVRRRPFIVKPCVKVHGFLSSANSVNETEADLSPTVPDTEDEITRLFMAIKEEAEREHCVPTYAEPPATQPIGKLVRFQKKRLRDKPNALFRYIEESIRTYAGNVGTKQVSEGNQWQRKVPQAMQDRVQAFIAAEDLRELREADVQYIMTYVCGIPRVSVRKKLKRVQVQDTSGYRAGLDIGDLEANLLSSTIYAGF